MASPLVTIGVPVRNGESQLAACLASLSNQTFRDLAIIVCDNASTDHTPEIIEAAMRADSRIQYIRHPNDIGMIANYQYALAATTSPYFMWRAYDDLSEPTYVERLVSALEENPSAALAAPRSETVRVQENRRRVSLPPVPGTGPSNRLAAERWMIRRLQAGWFYGLFRRSFLVEAFTFTTREFRFSWAGDFLLLATTVLRTGIVGVPEVTFTQRLIGEPKLYPQSEATAERVALVRNYWHVIELLISEKKMSWYQRILHRMAFVYHVRRRVAKWPILLRALAGVLFREDPK